MLDGPFTEAKELVAGYPAAITRSSCRRALLLDRAVARTRESVPPQPGCGSD